MLNTFHRYLGEIFKILLFIVMMMSFYIFVMKVVIKSNDFKGIFSSWQFPMMLALFLDVAFIQ